MKSLRKRVNESPSNHNKTDFTSVTVEMENSHHSNHAVSNPTKSPGRSRSTGLSNSPDELSNEDALNSDGPSDVVLVKTGIRKRSNWSPRR